MNESGFGILNSREIRERISQLDNWELEYNKRISKSYEFKNFKEALAFTNKVGDLAEEANHHPDIQLSYGRVIVQLETHERARLTDKDFNLAQLVNEIK